MIFEPYLRPQVWGGDRLQADYHKCLDLPRGPIGESWELSGHPAHVSRVARGPLAGQLLSDVWRSCQQNYDLPCTIRDLERFPWLVKFLDCRQTLSVQVHPHDQHARDLKINDQGKTEAWYILDVEPGSCLYLGWNQKYSPAEVQAAIRKGRVEQLLQRIEPQAGDVYLVPAGTVHAIGQGILLLEVQQPSDATFRLYDWNRVDHEGCPRPLHVEQAFACLDWDSHPFRPLPVEEIPGLPAGVRGQHRVTCAYFSLDEYDITSDSWKYLADELTVYVVVAGSARLTWGQEQAIECAPGQTVLFLPDGETYECSRLGETPLKLIQIRPGR